MQVTRILLPFLVACSPPRALPTPSSHFAPTTAPAGYSLAQANEQERQLFARINAERAAAGVPALTWNSRLALNARERCVALSQATGGDHALPAETEDHVRRVNLATSVFVEKSARAPTVDDAHRAWMANPRQRANILSAVVNQVGVGVSVVDHATFAVEVFVHLGPRIDPILVVRDLRGKLPTTVKNDADLTSIAQEFAERLAAGESSEEAWPAMQSRVTEIERRYTKIHRMITAVADVADVDAKALIGTFPGDAVGVGVAQGTHPALGDGAVWIVVMLGEELHSYKQ